MSSTRCPLSEHVRRLPQRLFAAVVARAELDGTVEAAPFPELKLTELAARILEDNAPARVREQRTIIAAMLGDSPGDTVARLGFTLAELTLLAGTLVGYRRSRTCAESSPAPPGAPARRRR
jgi:hypothetical protein